MIHRKKSLNKRFSILNSRFSELRRDVDEFAVWLDERLRVAKNLGGVSDNLGDKVKLFQRHKALGAEIEANGERLGQLVERCEQQLRLGKCVNRAECEQLAEELRGRWGALGAEFRLRADELEGARDILEFNDQLGQVDEWLKEKELMLQNGDTGRDFEHCVLLVKRADEAISPMNEQKLQEVTFSGVF